MTETNITNLQDAIFNYPSSLPPRLVYRGINRNICLVKLVNSLLCSLNKQSHSSKTGLHFSKFALHSLDTLIIDSTVANQSNQDEIYSRGKVLIEHVEEADFSDTIVTVYRSSIVL